MRDAPKRPAAAAEKAGVTWSAALDAKRLKRGVKFIKIFSRGQVSDGVVITSIFYFGVAVGSFRYCFSGMFDILRVIGGALFAGFLFFRFSDLILGILLSDAAKTPANLRVHNKVGLRPTKCERWN